MSKEEEIDEMRKEIKEFDEQATIAYKNRDYALENKYQAEIDKRAILINQLQAEIDFEKYPTLDVEKKITELKSSHKWSDSIRCDYCGMKTDTFYDKVNALRDRYERKEEFTFLIDSALCDRRFKV